MTGTITLTSGQIQISGPLLITGPGADQLTISGSGTNGIFSIFLTDPACPALDGPDYLVSISGLTLANDVAASTVPAGRSSPSTASRSIR